MAEALTHELEYRGKDALALIAGMRLAVCGVGSVGSNLVCNLARQGFRELRVIDFDRVTEANVGTQAYGRKDAGLMKAAALQTMIYRDVGVSVEPFASQITPSTINKLLRGVGCIVDCLDNQTGRALIHDYATKHNIPCLHIGTDTDYAEVTWNERYTIPLDRTDEQGACDIPLARNIIMLAIAVASEVLIDFAVEGVKRSYHLTLKDRRITMR